MSAISTILTRLRAAIWAIDVRDDIANAIEQCYSDVSNPTLQTEALEAALQEKIDQGEMAALTIGDHTITAVKLANGVIPAADATLTETGKPADAAETGRQIGLIKADLDAQTGIIRMTKNAYIQTNTTPISLEPHYSSAGRMYAIIDCVVGDKFVINAYSNFSAAREWCFIDSSNNAISMSDANAPITNLELTAPTNAVKLIINDKSGGMSYKVGNNLATKCNGLSDDIKSALLACFDNVAWANESGRDYFGVLKNALNVENWDYQWSADSGMLPQFMTANSYNFTTEEGALYAIHPLLDFDYTGNCMLEITIKSPSTKDSNPQILIRNAVISEGQFRGIKIIMAYGVETGVEYGVCGVSVNGVNALLPSISSNEYHTYRLTAIDNVYTVTIDGEDIDITQNDNTSPYYGRTGITTIADFIAYIKNIKFKRL